MGIRNRNGEKKIKEEKKNKLQVAQKEFTRSKAMTALSAGADFNDKKFTNHRNYHVRLRAWRMAGGMVPDNANEKKNLFDVLSHGCSASQVNGLKTLLGFEKEAA